jgi:hypothetical protein
MYIELKSGHSFNGPAWIGLAQFSKSGKTIYFNNQCFKRLGGRAIDGNFEDLITGDEYWISGVKKDGTDRLWSGGSKITIQKEIVKEYLDIIGEVALDPKKYDTASFQATDKTEFSKIENEPIEDELDPTELRFKEVHKLTAEELEFMIEDSEYCIETARYNKGRRTMGKYLNTLIEEKEKRVVKNSLH